MTVITEANKTKARELTAQLTLDEKIAIVHAAGLFRNGNAERLGIPPLRMDDGPMGVRAELHNDNWAPLYNTRDYVPTCRPARRSPPHGTPTWPA